jgi:hypothetical protein
LRVPKVFKQLQTLKVFKQKKLQQQDRNRGWWSLFEKQEKPKAKAKGRESEKARGLAKAKEKSKAKAKAFRVKVLSKSQRQKSKAFRIKGLWGTTGKGWKTKTGFDCPGFDFPTSLRGKNFRSMSRGLACRVAAFINQVAAGQQCVKVGIQRAPHMLALGEAPVTLQNA